MAQRDPRTDPRPGDTCMLDGVLWVVTDYTDDLVYLDTDSTNAFDVWNPLDMEYYREADAEAAAGGDLGEYPYGACWLKEDWASAPASDWASAPASDWVAA